MYRKGSLFVCMVPQGYESIMAGRHGNQRSWHHDQGALGSTLLAANPEGVKWKWKGFKLSEPAARGTPPQARLPVTSPTTRVIGDKVLQRLCLRQHSSFRTTVTDDSPCSCKLCHRLKVLSWAVISSRSTRHLKIEEIYKQPFLVSSSLDTNQLWFL